MYEALILSYVSYSQPINIFVLQLARLKMREMSICVISSWSIIQLCACAHRVRKILKSHEEIDQRNLSGSSAGKPPNVSLESSLVTSTKPADTEPDFHVDPVFWYHQTSSARSSLEL